MKERIETIIDRLWEYVQLNGKTTTRQAAAALGLTGEQVERMALLLEEHGLIEVRYGLFGVTLLDKGILAPVQKSTKPKSEAETQAHQLESEILQAENLMAFFEKDIQRRISKAEAFLNELEKKDDLSAKELEDISKEVDMALGQLAAFSDEVHQLNEKENQFLQKLDAFRQKITRLKARQEVQHPTTWFEKIGQFLERILTRPLKPVETKHERPSLPEVTFAEVKKNRVLRQRRDKIKEHYWVSRKRRSE